MALLCTSGSEFAQTLLAVACGGKLVVGVEKEPADSSSPSSCHVIAVSSKDSAISCLTFSSSGHLLADCSEDKTLRVWDTADWQLRGSRVIPKRATAMVITGGEQQVLVADKTGEVWQYSLSDSTLPGTHLLGHFSMLLDMVVPSGDSHVITCDRDEKIRVSKYPNSYNIERFCLGHQEFVSSLCLCAHYPHLLLSGSGDGTIRVWNWREGRLLHTVHCPSVGEEPLVVVQLACSHSDTPIVAAIIESLPEILLYNLLSDGSLLPCVQSSLRLTRPSSGSSEPWSCAIDHLDRLWVCQSVESEPLLCYQLSSEKVTQCAVESSPLLSQLCKWEYFKGAETRTRAFSDLKKHTFDNMSAYLARKEERIKEQQERKAKHELKKTPAGCTQRGAGDTAADGTVELSCSGGQSPASDTEQIVERSSVECSLGESGEIVTSSPPKKKSKTSDTSL